MTQIFDEMGGVTPVTIVQAGPCFVAQVKTKESDGYEAIQIGFGEVKERRLTQGQKGHLGLLKTDKKHLRRKSSSGIPAVRHLREFRTGNAAEYQVGQTLTVEQFEEGDRVDVTGKTKGRGFAGTVKRYGFGGGVRTHGQSDRHRAPGSIGAASGTGHVFKGKRMPGHYGNVRHTEQNLEVVRIDVENNLIAIKGAIPGTKGDLVIIRDSAKS
ncbi:MAG: 50S ribosomal protein L3 [Ardenticatenaceae bacterium]|nr:50S ribosomal protein L3 [Anaerolineales bacterium]MCB8922604.1 50S ribosomal protein L3 [Ardenticatenaceae bacterium]MCB8991272.1 50S ribosomal protein L3 [Ardenticatenaceae bacterium]MCB9003687.1 50S ribosomal protein L3 [Ardenticatenaceae bacterium]